MLKVEKNQSDDLIIIFGLKVLPSPLSSTFTPELGRFCIMRGLGPMQECGAPEDHFSPKKYISEPFTDGELVLTIDQWQKARVGSKKVASIF